MAVNVRKTLRVAVVGEVTLTVRSGGIGHALLTVPEAVAAAEVPAALVAVTVYECRDHAVSPAWEPEQDTVLHEYSSRVITVVPSLT